MSDDLTERARSKKNINRRTQWSLGGPFAMHFGDKVERLK